MRNLRHELEAGLTRLPDRHPLVVGYSGGMDSTALLHALAGSAQARARGLRAVHVNHGLHTASATWAARCAEIAATMDVPVEIVTVDVARSAGTGIEDAARRARFAAFSECLRPGEILALAHHRDDQAETVLLKLLRGAGPQGLGGMRALRPFAPGYLWRPLLDLPRTLVREYAHANALQWIEDPSNLDTGLRRNFLRSEILPRLAQRWPDADAALAHSATWARAAADFIDSHAQTALTQVRSADAATLVWRHWLALPDALRDPVLRLWLRTLGRDEPAHTHVAELERQWRQAPADRMPCVRFRNTELRRYRDLLYAMAPLPDVPEAWETAWTGSMLALPAGGSLHLEATGPDSSIAGAALPALQVRYRRGGERIKPAGATHTRELRLLLQEAGIPPWQRARIPLIHAQGELIAVGDLFMSAGGRELCERLGARIIWTKS